MSKLGKATRDIFASTTSPTRAKDGRATKAESGPTFAPGDQPYVKATVVLRTDQVVFLDRVCSDIRAKSGAAIARAELIRALVDALSDCRINVTSARNEADLRSLFVGQMKE